MLAAVGIATGLVTPIPPLEDRCQQVIFDARLTVYDIKVMWDLFQRYDPGQTGIINQDSFHKIINDEELLFFFGMCIFDLIGARNYKAINFRCAHKLSEQLLMVTPLMPLISVILLMGLSLSASSGRRSF